MILLDSGPLVALFDPKDRDHAACVDALERARAPLFTTLPVLTEAFHLLTPGSRGAENLMIFVERGGCEVAYLDDLTLGRAFELMRKYKDHPMDLADASLVTCAELLKTTRLFTLDRADFETYRAKRGHRHLKLKLIP